jgi:hypothetical protein
MDRPYLSSWKECVQVHGMILVRSIVNSLFSISDHLLTDPAVHLCIRSAAPLLQSGSLSAACQSTDQLFWVKMDAAPKLL